MIDKNGKIGGKVNLIDLLIVIVILAVAAFVGYRFILKDRTGIITNETVIIEFTSEEVNDFTVARLEAGVPVMDYDENNYLGTMIDFRLGEPANFDVDEYGETVRLSRPDCKSVVLTAEAAGTLDGNGVVIGGARYGIGHSMVIFAGDCKLFGKISGIDPA